MTVREALIRRLEQAQSPIEEGQEVEIGVFTPEDALGVSLVYYDIYGGDFPLDLVYDPEELIRRNAGDDQCTVVARTARGEVVGTIGMYRNAPHPDVYEFGQLNVIKSYRRGHLAAELSRFILNDVAAELGAPVLYGEGVCNHPISQRLAMSMGFQPTGLELECMPAGAYQGEGAPDRNVSLLLFFKLHEKRDAVCHLPERYRAVVADICDELGIACEFASGGSPSGLTESTVFSIEQGDMVRLTVPHVGKDFGPVLERATAQVSERGVMQVYLNLGDPGCPEAAEHLRRQGFFYAGFLPGWFGDPGLVLQTTRQEPDWEAIRLYGKRAKALLEYIREDRAATLAAMD